MLALLPKMLRTQRKLPLGKPSVFMFLTKYKNVWEYITRWLGLMGKNLSHTMHCLELNNLMNQSTLNTILSLLYLYGKDWYFTFNRQNTEPLLGIEHISHNMWGEYPNLPATSNTVCENKVVNQNKVYRWEEDGATVSRPRSLIQSNTPWLVSTPLLNEP